MQYNRGKLLVLILGILLSFSQTIAQISPGDLANVHAHLEGISNCTQCHILGSNVSSEKCLACHTEIQERITLQKGYHSSAEVEGKECFVCHNDHHGKTFQIVRFDIEKFDHALTGYPLSLPHAKKECIDCHDIKFISDTKIKAKKYTFLGVTQECLNCHTDYHQKTLSSVCLNCHNPDAFKPATKFNHVNTKFQLLGQHKNTECVKCHKIEMENGTKTQKFSVNKFSNCNDCHSDPHQNKFGQECRQCHNEESFKVVKGIDKFDHNKTDFRLEGKHQAVNCRLCHKINFTNPVKHNLCLDCHTDYHKKQFVVNGVNPDCSKCHTVKGFNLFSYTIAQHNESKFPIQGSHLAVPCIDCHKKQATWNFRNIGFECKDCHKDIHESLIPSKYYPEENCKICHNVDKWSNVSFNHSSTEFKLTGAHQKQDCRSCHITKAANGTILQKFSGLSLNCSSCHTDKHFKQFDNNGITNCNKCHDTESWKASLFDHNLTAFKLDGKHVNVPCLKCHKTEQDGSSFYVKYKLNVFTCESCHS